MSVAIIGGGLAGSECAWQLGSECTIFEMRPEVSTKAHRTDRLAELVCSNSFRGAELSNAVGLLKEELRRSGSLIMEAADHARLPAGGALAVDREVFSEYVTNKIASNPLIKVERREVLSLAELSSYQFVVIATGPLTGSSLASELATLTGSANLAFYDAISPIVTYDSLDHEKIFVQSRYDKGTADYLNVPLDKEQYLKFVADVNAAEKHTGHEDVDENLRPFEGCMPIEDMAERGTDTLRFGPLKPKGLTDPAIGREPYAVIQLRKENQEGTIWGFVGLQTRMKHGEQKRILRSLPGLENAEFVRLGSVHRNTFINSPQCLDKSLQLKSKPQILFAGQITGVEGYVESTACGLVAGRNLSKILAGKEPVAFPKETAIGSLINYITEPDKKNFQPMNISFGLMPSYFNQKKVSKRDRRLRTSEHALESLENYLANETDSGCSKRRA